MMPALVCEEPHGAPDDQVQRTVRVYEELHRRQGEVDLGSFWADRTRRQPLDEEQELACLSGLIKVDLRRRIERGETPGVAGYLDAFPQLQHADSRMVSLIYEEYCLREERGDAPDPDSFCDRYPDWRDSVASQLRYHRLLSETPGFSTPKIDFPEPGDHFEEFVLRAQIGKGGYSRVFVANDLSLGGKRVVLKVSVDRGQEAEAQGALDHPHIVPVNAVVYPPEPGLRGLSMPFRPGSPLDDVIRRIRQGGARPRSALDLWDALAEGVDLSLLDDSDDDLGAVRDAGPRGDGWKGFPIHGTFAQGAAWIGLILAGALQYAHGHRTFHRDVKPGNVLLTLHHGPQLLDFNLAHSPHTPQEAAAILGGTLPYMAPEQIEAFLVPERRGDVGALADVYSLGLVLHELLTGEPPDLPDASLPPVRAMRDLLDRRASLSTEVRRHDPGVPHALEAIVKKCLRLDPNGRYASAGMLAEDLDDFLHRRPPRHAGNPSRMERLVDWATRNRRSLIVNGSYLCLLGLLAPLAWEQAGRWFQPALKDRAEFRRAVAAVDQSRYQTAVELLMKVAEEYPNEPLPRFYLGIALSHANLLPEDSGLFSYGRAMGMPGAEAALRSWAVGHPKLAEHLRWFGVNSLEKTQEGLNAAASPDGGSAVVDGTTRHIIDVAAHALRSALAVDPTSKEAIQNLATIAEFRQDYQEAHDRLSDLLRLAHTKDADVRPAEISTWKLQRSRVATLRAKELSASPVDRDRRHALVLADEAVADLDDCAGAIVDFQRLYYLSFRTETLLSRGEIRRLLGKPVLGSADAREAKRTLETWLGLARSSASPVPKAVERGYLDRVRDLCNLESTESPDASIDPPSPEPSKAVK
jgi:serine/threonine protein kinase